LQHLFFNCSFARIIWRNSPWPLDSAALNFSNTIDWVKLIISPALLGIPPIDCHKFQIFAAVSCDLLWYYRNKAFHDALSFSALQVSQHINKVSLEHFSAWNQIPAHVEH
jgi:hypothetical protein